MVETERVALLEAQVAVLEEALEQRSHELRAIQRSVCPRDLRLIARIVAGLDPVPSAERRPSWEGWEESTALVEMDVESAMERLWAEAQREVRSRTGG